MKDAGEQLAGRGVGTAFDAACDLGSNVVKGIVGQEIET